MANPREIRVSVRFDIDQASKQQLRAEVNKVAESAKSATRPLSELGQNLDQAGKNAKAAGMNIRLLNQEINVSRIIAWAVAWGLAYRALNLVFGVVGALTVGALRRLGEFQTQQIALASELVNLNPALPFDRAMRSAGAFLNVLVQLQPQFIGTQERLQEVLVGTARYFGQVDLTSEAGRRNFLAFANAIQFATVGINRQGQALQEIRSISEGIVRPGAQLLQLLQRQDPHLQEHLRLWRAQGTVIENIVKLLPGYVQAVDRIGGTLPGQSARLRANIDVMLRETGEDLAKVAQPFLRGLNWFIEGLPGRRIVGRRVEPEDLMLEKRLDMARLQVELLRDAFIETTDEGLKYLFETGKIGSAELEVGLKRVAEEARGDLEVEIASRGKNIEQMAQRWLNAELAAAKYSHQLRLIREQTQEFTRFEVPEAEARLSLQRLQTGSGLGRAMVSGERGGILQEIRSIQEARLAERNMALLRSKDEAEILRINKDILAIRREIAQTDLELIRNAEDLGEQYKRQGDLLLRALEGSVTTNAQARGALADFSTNIANLRQSFLRSGLSRSGITAPEVSTTFAGIRDQMRFSFAERERALRGDLADTEFLPEPQRSQRRVEIVRQLIDLLTQQATAQRELNVEEREAVLSARQRDSDVELEFLKKKLDLLNRIGASQQEIKALEEGIRTKEAEALFTGMSPTQLRRSLDLLERERQFITGELRFPRTMTFEDAQKRLTAVDEQIALAQRELRTRGAEGQVDVTDFGKAQATVADITRLYNEVLKPALSTLITESQAVSQAALQRTLALHGEIVTAWGQMGRDAAQAFIRAFEDEYGRVPGIFQPRNTPLVPQPPRQNSGINIYIGQANITDHLSESARREIAAAIVGSQGDAAAKREQRFAGLNPIV